MIQDLLDDPDCAGLLATPADKRGVTPLFWDHVHTLWRSETEHDQPPHPQRVSWAWGIASGSRGLVAVFMLVVCGLGFQR
jgi:hypothetical protein